MYCAYSRGVEYVLCEEAVDWWEKIIQNAAAEDKVAEADSAFIEAVEMWVRAGVPYRGSIFYQLAMIEFMGIDSRRWESIARELWGDDFSGGETCRL